MADTASERVWLRWLLQDMAILADGINPLKKNSIRISYKIVIAVAIFLQVRDRIEKPSPKGAFTKELN